MPQRAAVITPKILLFLILPGIVRKEVKKACEERVRIVLKNAGRQHHNVSIQTRSISRELRAKIPRAGYRESAGEAGS